jgi:hypothetical protein
MSWRDEGFAFVCILEYVEQNGKDSTRLVALGRSVGQWRRLGS